MESNKTASVNDAYASPVTPTGPPRTTTNQNDKVLGSVPINWIKGIEMDLSRTSYRLKDLRNRIGLQSSKIDHVHTATQICFRSIASVEAKADEVAVICNEMRNILPGLCQLQSILIRQIGQSTADLNDFFQTKKFKVSSISCYDPAFLPEDTQLLEKLEFTVDSEEISDPSSVAETLYYMPHAPRSFTETFIKDIQPKWILGNDLNVTAGTLTKAKFLEQLPTLATIQYLIGDGEDVKPKDDGFSVVSSRRKKKNSKLVYKEPVLEYPVGEMYFSKVEISRIKSDSNQPWKDSFSDMALNVIVAKNGKKEEEEGKEEEKEEKEDEKKED
ncbi:hypothetical protein CXQ85_002946 [Candidozyma haemuli]|uniref:SRR1-like domain-containing protein n=1 Tax=Candidozyma haemuli TaxID=45357 RepID=A0A2V1AYQ1_9ASCO|nr:hypothetical protein CXQ85_002946 [[Candida] haemuloni]PVH23217.1 hypothetical protein CXQ85_002946 [[Candida] haemuloni]